jgi:hypothetical protein
MNPQIERMAREASNVGSADELTGDAIERFARLIAEDCVGIVVEDGYTPLSIDLIRERYK